ncbi:hypothetical protein C8R47DRAFT_1328855 [Mycena vitilis]|nr:hypothetical protein C8R47DRAFT_1328855 [Mycena vitilis]
MPYTQPASLAGKPFVILGAGTLGRRIALMWLTQGETVHLVDPSEKALADASAFISANLPDVIATHVPGGSPGKLNVFQDRAEAIKNAWIVVEVVPEILDLKIALLGELDAILPDDCILASNSSSYTGSEMFERVQNRARLVNTHYYMPPQVLPLEVMPNPHTDPAVVELLLREAPKHGLRAYHVRKESVGLLFNRIWAAIKREALSLVAEDIALPAEVDAIMGDIYGLPPSAGVFAMIDKIGLDVALAIEEHYAAVGDVRPEAAALLREMVGKGLLGVKSGKGFYEYPATNGTITGKAEGEKTKDTLIFLDVVKGDIRSIATDGSGAKILVGGLPTRPDGVQLDVRPGKGHMYYTLMGPTFTGLDGSVARSNLDGSDPIEIVPTGATRTPKQLQLVLGGGANNAAEDKLYWCDREGGKLMRCNLDGSQLETLYSSVPSLTTEALTDQRSWCVGLAIDTERGLVYWSQKGSPKGWCGRIFRAPLDCPNGVDPGSRTDVEVLFTSLPEPIDMELYDGHLYWTDRGDPPFGNSLNRADVSAPLNPANTPKGPSQELLIAERFHEAVGLAIDAKGNKIYVTDLLGSLWVTDLDGGNKRAILRDEGNFTGLTFLPAGSGSV